MSCLAGIGGGLTVDVDANGRKGKVSTYGFFSFFPSRKVFQLQKNKKNQSPDLSTLAPDRALLADARRGRRCCRISSGLHQAVGESRPSRNWSSGASSPRPPRTPCRRRAPPPSHFRLEPPLSLLETAEHHRCLRPPLSACHGTRHLAQWTRTKMSGGRERGWHLSRGELT